MSSDKRETRRTLAVDRNRYPLLAQWVEANPYYWQDALRDMAEAELAAGRLQLLVRPPSRRPKRPRGAPPQPPQRATTQERAASETQAAGRAPSSEADAPARMGQATAPSRATSSVIEQPVSPPPVVQGAGDATKRSEASRPAPVAGSAAAQSGAFPENRTQENTYAPEPAHTKAEPGAPENADHPRPSPEDAMKEIARRQLLGNMF